MTVALEPARNYGAVFTRRWVVETLLDLTGYTVDRNLAGLRLVEPSCGEGAFLGPAVERLLRSAAAHDSPAQCLVDAIRAYDLQADHIETSRRLCYNLLVAAETTSPVAERLVETWVQQADFLVTGNRGILPGAGHPGTIVDDAPADVVIGNPPYIRYDDLTEAVASRYRDTWPTMRGRGDIYVGFIERSLRMLRAGGRVGFICADRWMRNQYGAELRKLVASSYAVQHIWTMHDVDAFETRVSAYPAITVLSNQRQGSAVIADTTADFARTSAVSLAEAFSDGTTTEFTAPGVFAHRLPRWFDGESLWPTGSPARLALVEYLNNQFAPLNDARTGTRVSIGIATGADNVYVTRDPHVAEPDRMLPLATGKDLTTGTFTWHRTYLVNPWTDDGNLVALDDYPRMSSYLTKHARLRDRFVAKKNPSAWHRTIDKVNHSLIARPKLLLQDMKSTIQPVLEPGGHYPHHNLYYVVSDVWDLEVLGGILLSRIAQAFIEAYCVRMRGGTLRFQAQYLKQIRVPAPDQIDAETQNALREAFRTRNVTAATTAAAHAYGIDSAQYDLASPSTKSGFNRR